MNLIYKEFKKNITVKFGTKYDRIQVKIMLLKKFQNSTFLVSNLKNELLKLLTNKKKISYYFKL